MAPAEDDLQTFHSFSSLPQEIRSHIWTLALTHSHSTPRIVPVTAHCSNNPKPTRITHLTSHAPPPALLSVSQEPRRIALQTYTCAASLNHIPVDLEGDVLLVGTMPILSRSVLKTLPDVLPRGLRHLSIRSQSMANREAEVVTIAGAMCENGPGGWGLRRLTIVFERRRNGERDRPTFRDAIWSEDRIAKAKSDGEGGMVEFKVCMMMDGDVGRLRETVEEGKEETYFVWEKGEL